LKTEVLHNAIIYQLTQHNIPGNLSLQKHHGNHKPELNYVKLHVIMYYKHSKIQRLYL